MGAAEVDAYMDGVPEPQRSTLAQVRATLEGLLPDAEQMITYGAPTLKVRGKGVAGFAAFAKHCSYLPMSGSVTAALAKELADYETTKGSVKFPVDQPLPEPVVRALVDARLAELGLSR
ncbi:MAG TPA: DUF1801 domain-containing protein [Motilibacterales bacterium]|nr:DUF1801 domain-containing protein [Motilibacterales bacterium]